MVMSPLNTERPAALSEVAAFWSAHPCNSALSAAADRREYFSDIESRRYRAEPHIPATARFASPEPLIKKPPLGAQFNHEMADR